MTRFDRFLRSRLRIDGPRPGGARAAFFVAVAFGCSAVLADGLPAVGATGYGLSVFAGDEPTRFEVEILGQLDTVGAGGPMLVARLSGEEVEYSGVLQGMSGSPVWIEGELVGAVMATWAFAKDPLCLVRPLSEMRSLSEYLDAGGHPTYRTGDRVALAPTRAGDYVEASFDANIPQDFRRGGEPTEALWIASGFASALHEQMEQRLGQPVFVAGSAGDENGVVAGGTLAPGDAVAVLLVDGDARLASVGTVTERVGDTILAFGHPFLGLGPVSLPMARAEVIAPMPSRQLSFKLAQPRERVGVVLVDRQSGVAGKLGVEADMLPLSVISTEPGLPEQRRSYELARLPALLPDLGAWAVTSTVVQRAQLGDPSLIEMELIANLRDAAPLRSRVVIDGSQSAQRVPEEVALPIGMLMANDRESVRIESVEVSLKRRSGIRRARIGRVLQRPERPKAGDELRLRVELLPYRQPAEWTELSLRIPEGTSAGPARVRVTDGGTAFSDEVARATDRYRNPSLEVLREAFETRGSADELVATLFSPKSSALAGEVELQRLPPSVRRLRASKLGRPSSAELPASALSSSRLRTEWVLSGATVLEFEIHPEAEKQPAKPREAPR